MRADRAALEEKLGHSFSNRDLLVRALTHKSWIYEHPGSHPTGDNEQLEFLGDSILGFLVSDALWRSYPELTEGHLSKLKAQLVSEANLLKVAHAIGVGQFLVLGRCEEMSGGRNKKTLLADAVEALIAAVYLDGGMDAARQFVQSAIVSNIELLEPSGEPGYTDYKTALQELAQARKLPMPRYSIVHESGPEHAKTFTIEARIGNEFSGEAEGLSKKSAGQKAAKLLLGKLRAELPENAGKR
jgi:ribonuclease-3